MQPRGSVTWTLISVMASSGVVKVARVVSAERWGGGGWEKLFARAEGAGGRERKGVMQAFQPHMITMLNVNWETRICVHSGRSIGPLIVM